jgi:hypothetical protein
LGYEVVPEKPLPSSQASLEQHVNELLERSDLSIHLVGRYDKQQARESELARARRCICPHKEYTFALEKCEKGELHSLIWIPDDLDPDTEQQMKFVRSLEEENLPRHAEVATVGFESLKDVVRETLSRLEKRRRAATESNGDTSACGAETLVYVIYHRCDADSAHLKAISNEIEAAGIALVQPVFEDEPDEIHRYHEANLRSGDGIVVFSEKSKSTWLQSQKSEIVKTGRLANSNALELLYYLAPPLSVDKETFRSRAAAIVHGSEEYKRASIVEFIHRIKAGA